MRSFTKVLITFMIILCLGVAGYSGWQILSKVLEYRRGDNTYEALEEHIDTDGGGETAVVRVHPRDADGVPGNGMDGVTIIPSGEDRKSVV